MHTHRQLLLMLYPYILGGVILEIVWYLLGRVHHASNAEYLDRNYGGILIIWDRLFGTFVREQPQTPLLMDWHTRSVA
jgi:hypothetical protein